MRMQKTIVALLALLFTVPLYATSGQEQVTEKVFTYLKQGKVEALATYLGSLKECPRDGSTLKEGTVPALCVKEKFSRDHQTGTYGGDINMAVESIKDPGYTRNVTLNFVRLDEAIKDGLAKMYEARFKSKPGTFNVSNYVAFYNTYKNTWLKNDVFNTMKHVWANTKYREHADGGYVEVLYNWTALGRELNMPMMDMLRYFLEKMYDHSDVYMIDYVWEYALKQKNGKAVFYDLKKAARDYVFARDRILPREYNERLTIAMQAEALVKMRWDWPHVMITPVPQRMKEDITKAIRKCYEIAGDKQKMKMVHDSSNLSEYFSYKTCDAVKTFAFRDKVYVKNADELREDAKAKLNASGPLSNHVHF